MFLPTLLVIDVQQAFGDPSWGERNNPDAETYVRELLSTWRELRAPLVHVRHESTSASGLFRRGTPAFEFKPEAFPLPGEVALDKQVNSAFIGTDLEERLRNAGADAVVVIGLTTNYCCSTTARMAAHLGFETWLDSDATATHARAGFDAETMHQTALASLDGECARVVTRRDDGRSDRTTSPTRLVAVERSPGATAMIYGPANSHVSRVGVPDEREPMVRSPAVPAYGSWRSTHRCRRPPS